MVGIQETVVYHLPSSDTCHPALLKTLDRVAVYGGQLKGPITDPYGSPYGSKTVLGDPPLMQKVCDCTNVCQ